jgi:hypothetical protein
MYADSTLEVISERTEQHTGSRREEPNALELHSEGARFESWPGLRSIPVSSVSPCKFRRTTSSRPPRPPFPFAIHKSSYLSTLHVLDSSSVVKQTIQNRGSKQRCIVSCFVICTFHKISPGLSYRGI